MLIRNVKVYREGYGFESGEIAVRDGLFSRASDCGTDRGGIIDGEGCYAIPGLIDLHFHGCRGYDFCDGTQEAFDEIARYEASVGVTTIAPATLTLPVCELERILSGAADYRDKKEKEPPAERARCADLVGINMEGPFISRQKKGAQNERYIISCDRDVCARFLDASRGLVKFVGIAPEENETAEEFIREMKGRVHLSLAHTNADYETAKAAFDMGADHAVHLYNAMPELLHRDPGVVGAVMDSPHVSAELICDGIHVHPAAVRAAFRMMGPERIILISDSLRAAGMPDGRYMLGGLKVDVSGSRAVLAEGGAIAGSVTNLADCMRTAVREMGIPLADAVKCVTANPAKKLGIYDRYGSIEPGKKADLVLLDRNLETRLVIKDGIRLEKSGE